ncbi:MAG: terminase large subunit, partial [Selenomonadales bacterium]|nr:terminase large subunit [Selenomonadales bacterium]
MDRVTEYATRVVADPIAMNAGNFHVLACKRHLRDLERQETEAFPYRWDVDASDRVLDYAETLTVLEGAKPRPVHLLDCQAFDVGSTFGWKRLDGNRRFRRRYKSVARQNGKTFENGIIGSYIANFSGYKYGKLFTVATKQAQAKLAWDEIAKFIRADKDLGQLFRIQDYKLLITALNTLCTIEALSKERSLDDGFRSIFASVDEIHQHPDNSIYKAIYNGQRSLVEALVSMITTRGKKLNSFCKEMDDYCINILSGVVTAEDFFIDIYCLDAHDDIWNPKNQIKANPFLCSTEHGRETLARDAQTAKDMGGADLRDFITKSLNMWVTSSDDAFVDAEKFARCGSARGLECFRGRECYVGLDLSSGGDLTTIALEFIKDDGTPYFWSHSFMPRGRLDEHIASDLEPYDVWESEGLITVTGGAMDFKNDYKFIIKTLRDLIAKHEIKIVGIAYDPHNADGVLSDLEEFGVPLMMITQSARFLNDATVDIRLLVKSEKIEYDRKNELMAKSFLNAAVTRNSFDEEKVDKKPGARTARIDPVDACIDAHTMYLKTRETVKVDVESELAKYLEMMNWKK